MAVSIKLGLPLVVPVNYEGSCLWVLKYEGSCILGLVGAPDFRKLPCQYKPGSHSPTRELLMQRAPHAPSLKCSRKAISSKHRSNDDVISFGLYWRCNIVSLRLSCQAVILTPPLVNIDIVHHMPHCRPREVRSLLWDM